MGSKPLTAYKDKEEIRIPNPYKSEFLKVRGKSLEVLYYVTQIKKDDGVFNKDELTPLIFENGKLIGWGWNYL